MGTQSVIRRFVQQNEIAIAVSRQLAAYFFVKSAPIAVIPLVRPLGRLHGWTAGFLVKTQHEGY